jgi:hypothetical protein
MAFLPLPETRYIYNISEISNGDGIASPIYTYSIPSMIEYVVHSENSLDRISRIHHCESIPELTKADLEEFREKIAYMYDYHSQVYNDRNFSGELLSSCLPQYRSLLGKSKINVGLERIKHHPSISPAFNGTGCNIL